MAAILLADASNDTPVAIDYRSNMSLRVNAAGDITAISLRIPHGTELPQRIRAYVIIDAFPIGETLR